MTIKPLIFLLTLTAAGLAQPVSVGVKVGTPLTEFFEEAQAGRIPFTSTTKRYTAGPTIEVHLPMRLSVEVDALYKRFGYHSAIADVIGGITSIGRTTGNRWEFPILAKYRTSEGLVRPYLAAGFSFNHISGLTQVTDTIRAATLTTSSTSDPAELKRRVSAGAVLGGGIELRAPFIKISPEIRYTRWGLRNFTAPGDQLRSNENQVEVLLGITF